ncbi:uncharacterized protein LOC127841508 [Dreissena polymorpha]|uniref:Uncharacterized protein n=1 Tax=Dreissena polymorpha TaxID=45954 RepID=A0A9D4IZ65_DREPO|nr:uncharacterized protein LOC127841508 [Dreissena polymorpha]KAH3789862.1 hypothetical protein DPMN_168051 [Dreissena polymorpha]
MGSTESKRESRMEGYRVDVARRPSYTYRTQYGHNWYCSGNEYLQRINNSLSAIKVCRSDAISLENTLRWEFFDNWQEECEIKEFKGYSTLQLSSLISDISEMYGEDSIRKLNGIQFCQHLETKKFEFIFGTDLRTGNLKFGTVVMTKNGDTVNAVCCVYNLKFSVAAEVESETTKEYFLGFETSSKTRTWTKQRSIGFVTQRSLINFCRMKALDEFQRHGVVSTINVVRSITDAEQ